MKVHCSSVANGCHANTNNNKDIAVLIFHFLQRQSVSPPAIPFNSSNEGESLYKAVAMDRSDMYRLITMHIRLTAT